MSEVTKYILSGKEYQQKEKYSFKEWGNILKIIFEVGPDKAEMAVVVLLADDKLIQLLNLILDRKVEDELYEDDFDEAARAVNDFFSRKKSLMRNIQKPSAN